MSRTAIDAVLAQATALTEQLVDTYEMDVAGGEVGSDGSGRASNEPIAADRPPRALLYGRVQSGKTVAMILTSALCLDNGFRTVVVLTSDNVALVKQTADRFKALDGPRVFSTYREGTFEWEGQEEQLRNSIAQDGLVLVCAKNANNLPHVLRLLRDVDASAHPVLILDDEADAATPDTSLAARAAGRPNAPAHASTINRLVVENDHPNFAGFSLGESLPHSIFVQVTATPYVLLLQCSDAQMRPTNTFLLEPGAGYCGGEVFFGRFDFRAAAPQPETIVIVDDGENDLMRRQVPAGLARSINFFMLAACAKSAVDGWPKEGFKHLSHTSRLINEHDLVSGHISQHLSEVRQILTRGGQESLDLFLPAYAELGRSVSTLAPLPDLLDAIAGAIRQTEVVRVNSQTAAPAYGPRFNFVVGGNILGRGLTIDNLLVTYYIREAKTSQMDTVWQHARMYGYRQSIVAYMRIYMPHRLGAIFAQIHLAEQELRDALAANQAADTVLIRVPRTARPTRPNALDADAMRTLVAGRQQIFPRFLSVNQQAARTILGSLHRLGVPTEEPVRENRPTSIPLEEAYALVNAVPIEADDPGLWDTDAVQALMRNYEAQFRGHCHVYVRAFETRDTTGPDGGWARGVLGGPEIAVIQRAAGGVPALALVYRGDPAVPEAWYPTLVMPPGTPTYVFNSQ
ncbi:Z1 domain-containing protein [Methylorubrum populi]|uniref:Z1 domain-containing protein n=1 Tax=Methylorubrum populi TaxID=223967 RepID=UPI001645EA43|nr:Z1 domain-containing protein [Methylorubrum populi]